MKCRFCAFNIWAFFYELRIQYWSASAASAKCSAKHFSFSHFRIFPIDQKPENENLISTLYMTNSALVKMVSKLAEQIKAAKLLTQEKRRPLSGKFGVSNKWKPFDFSFF